MKKTKAILIRGLNCLDPTKEQEFNEQYDIHARENLERGAKRVTRYRVAPYQVEGAEGPQVAYPKYLTIYEFDSEESLRANTHSACEH